MATQRILIDSTFWIDLLDRRNVQTQENTLALFELIEDDTWVVPMPTLYETVRTRLLHNTIAMNQLENLLKRPNVELIYDDAYRAEALEQTIDISNYKQRKISLVDMIIRNIIKDVNINIHYLVTNNHSDFEDICQIRGIEIISTNQS